MLLPRTIDKARAMLDGGELGDYFISPGLSGFLLERLRWAEADFIELVRTADTEEEVSERVLEGVSPERRERLNAFLESLTVAQVTPDLRAQFTALYGSDLPPEALVIDVIAGDDRAAFA